jgi:hypothetical protein
MIRILSFTRTFAALTVFNVLTRLIAPPAGAADPPALPVDVVMLPLPVDVVGVVLPGIGRLVHVPPVTVPVVVGGTTCC